MSVFSAIGGLMLLKYGQWASFRSCGVCLCPV